MTSDVAFYLDGNCGGSRCGSRRRNARREPRRVAAARRGFSLVELLAVIGIIGMLAGLLLPAVQYARESSRRTKCASNMRQVGLAIMQFCDTHRGNWPDTTHTVQVDPLTGRLTQAWIYTIAPYMEKVDEIRICPDDPAAEVHFKYKSTSYTLNGYLSRESTPPFDNRRKLASMSKTIVAFELSEIPDAAAILSGNAEDMDTYTDHVHSFDWFRNSNIRDKKVYGMITNEVAVDRHTGCSHFLYADGHVDTVTDDQVYQWATKPFNFAIPLKK